MGATIPAFTLPPFGDPMKRRLLLATLLLALPATAQQRASVGQQVPEFSFGPFLNGDGRQNLSEFFGTPVMIDFWGVH